MRVVLSILASLFTFLALPSGLIACTSWYWFVSSKGKV